MYIAMMGPQLADASEVAISPRLPGAAFVSAFGALRAQRQVAECILDLRPLKALTGITEDWPSA
jgi:glycine dehydrogenase